ncbi:hypothetical protein G6F68_017610 [Rhizopus microsporus]|nr:hypothetical protein G6F68_017610 [Rhizopus microsporus]
MLLTMKALTEAARAVSYVTAAAHDKGTHHPDPEPRSRNRAFYEYMVPIVKGYSTETAVEVASLGIQVHGGMGFIEETGAAQYYRDAPGQPQDAARRRRHRICRHRRDARNPACRRSGVHPRGSAGPRRPAAAA